MALMSSPVTHEKVQIQKDVKVGLKETARFEAGNCVLAAHGAALKHAIK